MAVFSKPVDMPSSPDEQHIEESHVALIETLTETINKLKAVFRQEELPIHPRFSTPKKIKTFVTELAEHIRDYYPGRMEKSKKAMITIIFQLNCAKYAGKLILARITGEMQQDTGMPDAQVQEATRIIDKRGKVRYKKFVAILMIKFLEETMEEARAEGIQIGDTDMDELLAELPGPEDAA